MKRLLLTLWLCPILAIAGSDRPQLSAAQSGQFSEEAFLSSSVSPWSPPDQISVSEAPDFVVAQDGSGTHQTIQAALNAVARAEGKSRVAIKPGTYREVICHKSLAPLLLFGTGKGPKDVQIVNNLYAGQSLTDRSQNPCTQPSGSMIGTAGSATMVLEGDDIQLVNLSVHNDAMADVFDGKNYPTGAGESGGAQGVALSVKGDRIHLQEVELWGHQDTFYVRRVDEQSQLGRPSRVLFERGSVAGDVDFIFGDATLVIRKSLVLSRSGRRTPPNGGHILAPSTPHHISHGFLVSRSWLLAEEGLKPASHSLGRAWDYGVKHGAYTAGISPNGHAVIRDSTLGPHIRSWSASTSRRPFSSLGPLSNRFFEFRNESTAGDERDITPSYGGWASLRGVSGGSMASAHRVFDASNRTELFRALAAPGEEPRIIRIHDAILMDTDEAGKRLAIDHFRDPDFSWEKFLHKYAPERWGRERPHGSLEDARKRSAAAQARHVIARIPSNTTIIGASPRAGIHFGGLAIDQGQNIIIRRLNFSQAYDHFPLWDPKDGHLGEWNSNYDNLSLRGAKGVWIDENHFTSLLDKEVPSSMLGRPVEHFDALLDITHRSDWITVSRNVFESHRKGTLVGGSDRPFDQGTLRVTFHNNDWHNVYSRSPRIRYGLVHAYNNRYTISVERASSFEYSVGIGVKAQVLLQSNVWSTPPNIRPEKLVKAWGGEFMKSENALFNGMPIRLAEGKFDENLSWSPPYRYKLQNALDVERRPIRHGFTPID